MVSITAPSISIRLPQSLVAYTSIFWNGDCTWSSLAVVRKPMADPVGWKCSMYQLLSLLMDGSNLRGREL